MHIQVLRVSSVLMQHNTSTDLGTYGYKGGGDYFRYNFAAVTPSIPAADRQSFYGSFTRDICDKYLTVFADFKYTRSFFDAALAATPFVLIHSSNRTVLPLVPAASVCQSRIRLIRSPWRMRL